MRRGRCTASVQWMPPRYRRAIDLALVATGVLTLVLQAWPLRAVHPVALAAALALVTCLPWLWRERWPISTLLICGGGLVASILVLHAYDWASVTAVVLLFLVALDGDRRRSVVVGVASAAILAGVVVALIPVIDRADGLSAAGTRVLAALGALVVGDLVRSRLRLRAAARERAQREVSELRDRADRQATIERLRIARDLHDTLAHALVAINVRAGVTAHLGVSPEAAEALTEIKDVSAQALTDLRATLDVLRDRDSLASREPTLGLAAVPRLLDQAQAAGVEAEADLSLDGATIPSVVDHAGFQDRPGVADKRPAPRRGRARLGTRSSPGRHAGDRGGRRRAGRDPRHWAGRTRPRPRGDGRAGRCRRRHDHRRPPPRPRLAGTRDPAVERRPPMSISVVIAEDQPIVRGGFRALIDAQPDMTVVAEAADGRQAITHARRTRPDLVLMDIRMPDMDGLAATQAITADPTLSTTRVLVLTTFELDEFVFGALRAGAQRLPAQGR